MTPSSLLAALPNSNVKSRAQHARLPEFDNKRQRMSIPASGHTLSAAVEPRAKFVRSAATSLAGALLEQSRLNGIFDEALAPRANVYGPGCIKEQVSSRAAWALVNMWLVAQASAELDQEADLADAEAWFYGSHCRSLPSIAKLVSPKKASHALCQLRSLPLDDDFWDLFPYILEPHGPGTRLSVMRDPHTAAARQTKRKSGVFYTPTDVADYIVGQVIGDRWAETTCGSLLDIACGTGVFLRSYIQLVAKGLGRKGWPADTLDLITEHLFGFDISCLIVESCTFVLLRECLESMHSRGISPWNAWHAIRLNLSATDSLKVLQIAARGRGSVEKARQRAETRRGLLNNAQNLSPTATWARPQDAAPQDPLRRSSAGEFISLSDLFPEVAYGFDFVVGNPPYARVGQRHDLASLQGNYESLTDCRQLEGADVYPLFVEMMWRMAKPGRNASGLVVPLSVAYHRGAQFEATRRALRHHGGICRFAFFDREPHALFGEDVKTRNAIILRGESPRNRGHGDAVFMTTPLIKSTSRTRKSLFDAIAFTPLGDLDTASLLPKLGSTEEVAAYERLSKVNGPPLWEAIRSIDLSSVSSLRDGRHVLVGGTAYNFMNVFMPCSLDQMAAHPLSDSPVHGLTCRDKRGSSAVFAALSSRLVFWLWHVKCDGFHVPRQFLHELPLSRSAFDPQTVDDLSQLGGALWREVQKHVVVSVNRGRSTIAFRPLALKEALDAVDKVILRSLGVAPSFLEFLQDFVRRTVIVDTSDAQRARALPYFG